MKLNINSNLLDKLILFLQILIIALLYYFSAKFGLSLAVATKQVTFVWPPTGISLAALLLLGRRVWPGVFLGAFTINLLTDEPPQVAMGIAIGNTLEAVVGAYLIQRNVNFDKYLSKVQDVLRFILYGAFIATTVSATIGVTSLILGGIVTGNYLSVWLVWWLGDMIGALIVTPLILVWLNFKNFNFSLSRILESILLLIIEIGVALLIFTNILPVMIPPRYLSHLVYMIFPLLIYSALRFGKRGTTLKVFLVSAISIYGTIFSQGPFVQPQDLETSLFFLQLFMGIVSITFIIFSTAIEEREQNEKKFQSLIEHSSDAISLLDERAIITYSSPSAVNILGYGLVENIGKYAFDLIHPEDKNYTMKLFSELISIPGKVVKAEFRILHKDGSWLWMEGIGTNLLNEPYIRAVVVNYRDITERKLIEKEKSDFVSLAAHQLRSPVALVKWYVESLMDKKINKNLIDYYLKEIYSSIKKMSDLINLLLNVSRIEMGTLNIEYKIIDISKICKEVIRELHQDIVNKKIKIEENYDENISIKSDPSLVQIVIQNIISNSIYYIPISGLIKIKTSQLKNSILITISDTGIGIPDKQKNLIFTKQFRGDNVKKSIPEGSGLGLYLVKSVIDKLKGKIKFESQEGRGTTFYISLPLKVN